MYATRDGQTCMKVRGFTLNYRASLQLTPQLLWDLVSNHDRNTVVNVDMGTMFRRNKLDWTISTAPNIKRYRFNYDKRILLNNSTTIPFGYTGPIPQPVGIMPNDNN